MLEATQPTVSRHLSYLKNSGLVLDRRDGYRIFYRLADAKQGIRKRLFEFLQDTYKNEDQLQADKKRLREAIQAGSCTVGEWEPHAALGWNKGTHSANRA